MREGDRVIALSSSDSKQKKTFVFGEGIYLGDLIPDEEKHGSFRGNQTLAFLSRSSIPNPVIKLDNGDHVFGCECWWGPQDVVKKRIDSMVEDGWEVIQITKDEMYKDFEKA